MTVILLVGGLLVGYVGLVLLSGGIVNVRRDRAFDSEGVPVDAVIVRTEIRSNPSTSKSAGYSSGGGRFLVVYYRYRTPDGRSHDGNASPPRDYASSLGVGDPLKVKYLPSDPGDSQLLHAEHFFPVLLGVLGIVLLSAGLAMTVKGAMGFRRREPQS